MSSTATAVTKDNDVADVCSICCEDATTSITITLECKHAFHANCLKQLVDVRCPMCRRVSKQLTDDVTIMQRAEAYTLEKRIKLEQEDHQYAQQLQQEDDDDDDDDDDDEPDVRPQNIARGSEAWQGVVESLVALIAESMGTDHDPLAGCQTLADRKQSLHNVLHGDAFFQHITCGDLRDMAGDALAHEMFGGMFADK